MKCVSLAVGCVTVGLVALPAVAADVAIPSDTVPAPAATARDFTLTVTPYLWAASINGNAGIGPVSVDFSMPFDKTLHDLDFTAMGHVELNNGRWGVFADGEYTKVSRDFRLGPLDIGVALKSTLFSIGGVFTLIDAPLGGNTLFGDPRSFKVEPMGGFRWTRLTPEISGDGHDLSYSTDWVDPFVGGRINVDLSERWTVGVEGDVGGFGTGTRFMLNGEAYLGYRMKLHSVDATLRIGYRALYQDYHRDIFHWSATQHGPGAGVSLRF